MMVTGALLFGFAAGGWRRPQRDVVTAVRKVHG
jgi:hypothetical protein